MNSTRILLLWLATAALTASIVFFLQDGWSKFNLASAGVEVIGVVTQVEQEPTNSRSFHLVSFEFAGAFYESRIGGAAGYAVGEHVPLVINPANPNEVEEGNKKSLLEELFSFCMVSAVFVATILTGYVAFRMRK